MLLCRPVTGCEPPLGEAHKLGRGHAPLLRAAPKERLSAEPPAADTPSGGGKRDHGARRDSRRQCPPQSAPGPGPSDPPAHACSHPGRWPLFWGNCREKVARIILESQQSLVLSLHHHRLQAAPPQPPSSTSAGPTCWSEPASRPRGFRATITDHALLRPRLLCSACPPTIRTGQRSSPLGRSATKGN